MLRILNFYQLLSVILQLRKRDIGKILVGFAVLMYGMTLMGSSVSGLEDSAAFTSIRQLPLSVLGGSAASLYTLIPS